MKKNIKWGIVLLAIIIAIFATYITEESIRLNKIKESVPLIILGQTKCSPSCAEIGQEITLEYFGVGYKLDIKYYHFLDEDNDIYKITGKEFKLFNKLMIWAWVE